MKYHVHAPTPEENVWTCLMLARVLGETSVHLESDYCRTAGLLMWIDSDEDLTFASYLAHWRMEP